MPRPNPNVIPSWTVTQQRLAVATIIGSIYGSEEAYNRVYREWRELEKEHARNVRDGLPAPPVPSLERYIVRRAWRFVRVAELEERRNQPLTPHQAGDSHAESSDPSGHPDVPRSTERVHRG